MHFRRELLSDNALTPALIQRAMSGGSADAKWDHRPTILAP